MHLIYTNFKCQSKTTKFYIPFLGGNGGTRILPLWTTCRLPFLSFFGGKGGTRILALATIFLLKERDKERSFPSSSSVVFLEKQKYNLWHIKVGFNLYTVLSPFKYVKITVLLTGCHLFYIDFSCQNQFCLMIFHFSSNHWFAMFQCLQHIQKVREDKEI